MGSQASTISSRSASRSGPTRIELSLRKASAVSGASSWECCLALVRVGMMRPNSLECARGWTVTVEAHPLWDRGLGGEA
ncbi:hypothetical protein GCM10010104_09940 [Streptomyces indiaensis]|uniref:Uncharacterized protein n=1 Tax=Streptomyces indiaensis TaxID=284033 RepID=A0ABN3D628_9ACTN